MVLNYLEVKNECSNRLKMVFSPFEFSWNALQLPAFLRSLRSFTWFSPAQIWYIVQTTIPSIFSFFFFFLRFNSFCSVFFASLLSLSSSASFSCIFFFSIYPILSSLSFCLLLLSSLFFYSSNMFCSSCMLSIDLFFLLLFLFFFCQLYPGLRNWKSVFLILKILQYDGWKRWIWLFPRYPCKNRYKNRHLHFYKTYDHQIWEAGTFTGFDSDETNQAGAADVITSRSRDKLKTYQE